MENPINSNSTTWLISLAQAAGDEIMKFYKQDISIIHKEDSSPVTEADVAAHKIIEAGLLKYFPYIPVVSEEGDNRDSGSRFFWLVDPLDGTKSFIKHTDDFTVNIALIDKDTPVFGVVYAPALDQLYCTASDGSCRLIKNNEEKIISVRSIPIEGMDIVASRSHSSPETEEFINKLKVNRRVNIGSSLKFCLVASGVADCYPRLGPTMEWDTAAAHAVVLAAGGRVETMDGKPLKYAKPDFRNPYFIVWGDNSASHLQKAG